MNLKMGKCKVQNLRRNNPMLQYMLGDWGPWLESSSVEKDLEVLVDSNLIMI